jgi:hypothetical protein
MSLVLILAGCRKPYFPKAIASSVNYLVVEGVINSGVDSTVIKLSRTTLLSGNTTSHPELNAVIAVESDQSAVYPVPEMGNGEYAASSLNLDNTRQYHLRIKTAGGREYLSDFVPVKNNPPIDSVGFVVQNNGVQLYVNTHDPNNNTKYYRWEYQETWQFHAEHGSDYITDGTAVVARSPDQLIFDCFGNDTSSSITLGSSAKLSRDVIYQSPITQVASTSEKLETKYSILVKQYALSADAYNFWVNLKKNTEQLGSIFDAQPSNINGNVHCVTDPAEPVIGYISVTNVQQKRVFILNAQLPRGWKPAYPYQCEVDTALFCRPVSIPCQNDVALFMIPIGSFEIPLTPIWEATPKPGVPPKLLGYLGTSRECTDCTIRGVVKQPIFWK